jgi:hypothetical protein
MRRRQGGRVVGPQQVDQFALNDDTGAPRLHRAGDALVDLHVKARPAEGEPCASPPMEPPATMILSGFSAPDMAGCLAQLGFHQFRAERAGEERDAIDEHGRNGRHMKADGALQLRPHLGLAFVRREHGHNAGAVQPGRCADFGQD